MSKKPTLWQLEPHTAAKHSILRRYLDAWFPILTSWAGRVVFVDGFAGPGEYSGGERGSPLLALDAAIHHTQDFSKNELIYLFIEAEPASYQHLDNLLKTTEVPAFIRWQAIPGNFAERMTEVLDAVEGKDKSLAPALILIDPFGFSGLPMGLLKRLAKHQRTEFIISLMYESIIRWRGQPQLEGTLDDLFGSKEWRRVDNMPSPADRKAFLLTLYQSQLKEAGMTYTRAFEMRDHGNRTEYYLIFATHSLKGLKVMKGVMWKVDPSGQYQFSDATVSAQLTLFQPTPDFSQLRQLILDRFAGCEVSIEVIEEFVLVDTAFRETHFKKQVLADLEKSGSLEVVKSDRSKRYAYPAGTVIRFG
ncbi:MAG: three-Cys-motif partner protein TcmP [Dehalococcoidia bacterium]